MQKWKIIKYFCISKAVIKKYKHKCKVKCKQWFLKESIAINIIKFIMVEAGSRVAPENISTQKKLLGNVINYLLVLIWKWCSR